MTDIVKVNAQHDEKFEELYEETRLVSGSAALAQPS